MEKRRLFLIVLDSVGIGEAPDAALFGDEGSNTVRAAVEAGADLPNLKKLGLFNIDGMDWTTGEQAPAGAFGRMQEASMGKDTTIGHWEIAGVVSPKPLPTFPDGFPPEIIEKFEQLTGRKVICNKPYSGTQLLLDYGREHVKTGALMVYTSADSVFQVAAMKKLSQWRSSTAIVRWPVNCLSATMLSAELSHARSLGSTPTTPAPPDGMTSRSNRRVRRCLTQSGTPGWTALP